MALTGLQIFKLLPNTNCKECDFPTCLAFAMKLAAGKEALDKCPYASDELKAALGAASLPPIRGVTVGQGERAVTVGEETVFFRHEKTFVRPPGLFRLLDPAGMSDEEAIGRLDEWTQVAIERAGEIFRVDGVALRETTDALPRLSRLAAAAAERSLPLAVLAATPDGTRSIVSEIKAHRPLIVPPAEAGTDPEPFTAMAAELGLPLVVWGASLDLLATAAEQCAKAGVKDLLLAPTTDNLCELHGQLSQLRRGALDRVHPGIAHPIYLQAGPDELEKGVLGISKFASLLVLEDTGGEIWLPLWTLRQNIYTDPQKPLQIDPGLYPIGEPDETAPLLVTTNFSLTYFIVSTELDGTGVPCRLAVVEAEGMSVLTAWSAGKFGGERVAQALQEMKIGEQMSHKTVIIPGYVAVISGELEDGLGEGWRVLSGPQEASDIGPFFRDVWQAMGQGDPS